MTGVRGVGGQRALRAYRALLRLYPASYLERFGEEMLETFAAAHADSSGSAFDRARFWPREIGGVVRGAARERWEMLAGRGDTPAGGSRPAPRRAMALAYDFRAALRTLRQNPGFAAGAALVFGLGTGVATLMFSIVDSVVLEPLDIPEADRVVQIQALGGNGARASLLPVSLLRPLVDEDDVFAEVAAFNRWGDILVTETEVRALVAYGVTPNFFPMVGTRVIAGRGLEPADYEPDAPRVAVLGHAFWQRHYGGDLDVIGEQLPLGTTRQAERPTTIVGILPADFRLPPLEGDVGGLLFATAEPPDIVHVGSEEWVSGQRGFAAGVLARLSEGVTLEQARSRAEALGPGVRGIAPAWMDFRGFELSPLPALLRRHYGPALYIFWAASGLLLLIACANVANLLTARGLMRRREMAVRTSLGADRGRLFAQLLAESGLLGLLGGLFGAAVAYVGIRVLVSIFPGNVYRLASAGLDGRALAFLVAASLVPPLAFGALPAWQGSGFGRSALLASSSLGSRAPRPRVLRALVVAQIALALVVVTGGSLLVRTYRNLTGVDLGYDAERVLTFPLGTFPGGYSKYTWDTGRLTGLVLDRLAGVPGVVSASNGWIPLTWDAGDPRWRLTDRAGLPEEEIRTSEWDVGPGFFETLGIDVVAGRTLGREDWGRALATRRTLRELEGDPEALERFLGEAEPLPVVINETMAVRYWGAPERAVGSELLRLIAGPSGRDTPTPFRVIGVVRDVRNRAHDTEVEPQTFSASAWRSFLVRTAIDPVSVAPDIRRAVEELDPVELSIPSFTTMEELVATEAVEERFRMQVLLLAAVLALVLAAVGLFGVMAYSVSRRTHEIAVRMSLGARAAEVVRLLAGQSLRIILVGIGIGLLGAAALARSMESLLFGVAPLDPASFAASALLLTAVSAVACYLPTSRATTVDPVEVLREE